MTGKERVTESGKGTSVLTLILSYPQNRDAKDWAAGNGRLSYLLMLLLLCLRVCVCRTFTASRVSKVRDIFQNKTAKQNPYQRS